METVGRTARNLREKERFLLQKVFRLTPMSY
jgi:hypothetical protein